MKKFEDILVQCVEDIKTGRSSIEDCLERYPAAREQLEPLLRIALAIQEPPDVNPSPGFKVRSRHQLMEQIHERQAVTRWPSFRYNNQIPQRSRFSMARMIVAIALALLALAGGTIYASQGSLPGDTLYPVKAATEQLLMRLPGDDVGRAERGLGFANRRIVEIEALVEAGRSVQLDLAVDKYDHALGVTLDSIEEARGKGLSTAEVSELVAEATAKHLAALDAVSDVVPEEAKAAITRAGEVSLMGQESALLTLAWEEPATAIKINLEAREERLNRARTMAEEGDIEEAENAVQQFVAMAESGEEISGIARELDKDVAEVAERVAAATLIHLDILSDVWDMVPDEAKLAIEGAMDVSIRGYDEAVEILEDMGIEVPELPELPGLPETPGP
ncbi:MAG: DUF5667 domain-containing protein [Chloroflexota bacterium]